MADKKKIGFIFECGREGPDVLVLRHFLTKLNPNFEMVPRTLDNKRRLIEECGPVAKLLLSECSRIVIVWDLFPAWREKGEKPCRHADRKNIFASLKAHGLSIEKECLGDPVLATPPRFSNLDRILQSPTNLVESVVS